ncbi:5-oxoprolinase subunit PxpA [Urechidicola sp. KH5]
MKKYSINCDMGEGLSNEAQIMPYIDYCNIACGGHFGDTDSMTATIELALQNNVKVGAHPSYPDTINFGRKSMTISNDALIESIQHQIETLKDIASKKQATISHIKAHGALYNDIAKNKDLAEVFLTAVAPYRNQCTLFAPYNSEIATLALQQNFDIAYEAFADRRYHKDLSLVSRNQNNAVINDPEKVLQHVQTMMHTSMVETISNTKEFIQAETFCVHSDTPNAIEILKTLHAYLQKHSGE